LRFYNQKAFFHFGVNTFTNLEWGDGVERESVFAPTEPDVRQWIKTVKAAGFTLAILTAKHHDGFCLWPSAYTEHSVKNSPYKDGKGDIVREFTDACREFDVRAGLYLSPWDRNAPFWGTDAYSAYYNAQLTELLTNYGRIDEVWWDGAGSKETPYDWGMWAHTVRNLQPEAVIFGSMGATPYVECRWVGNERGYAGDPHYATVNHHSLAVEDKTELNKGVWGGERFTPAEVDVSIRPGWFYHKDQDDKVKSTEKIVDIWFDSVGKGAMMLLNFPPDRRGLIHETDARNAILANRVIKQTFAVNLAEGAYAYSDSVRAHCCEPDCMLNHAYDSVYAASDENITPTVEIKLPAPETFDVLKIGEYIELGYRVCGFRLEAFIDGDWKPLLDKQSIGYQSAWKFAPVTTDRVRLVIYDAAAAPVIREFGLYKLPADYRDEKTALEQTLSAASDLATGESAQIVYEEDGATVMLGGLYPFNTVCFNGTDIRSYELLIFNGSTYDSVYRGNSPDKRQIIRLPQDIDWAYQLKLVTGRPETEALEIEVYKL